MIRLGRGRGRAGASGRQAEGVQQVRPRTPLDRRRFGAHSIPLTAALALLVGLAAAAGADDPADREGFDVSGEERAMAASPAPEAPGSYGTPRTLQIIRDYPSKGRYTQDRAYRALARFGRAGSYAPRTPSAAEEVGRKAFDLVPLRIFGLGQTLVSAPFCAAYLVTLVTGGSEDVTEICFAEPVDQTFRTPLGDL